MSTSRKTPQAEYLDLMAQLLGPDGVDDFEKSVAGIKRKLQRQAAALFLRAFVATLIAGAAAAWLAALAIDNVRDGDYSVGAVALLAGVVYAFVAVAGSAWRFTLGTGGEDD